MKEKFLPEGVIQACFATISLTYHLFWKKKRKEKENKSKVEKYHIYTTQWQEYTPSLILKKKKKKKTHTKQYYVKTVQLNKEKSN